MTTCLVPLKDLRHAKRRLARLLRPSERKQICLAMLVDVLTGLRQVSDIGDIRVLTPDAEVGAALRARHIDAAAMRDAGGGGLNEALSHAVGVLEREGVSRMLIIPADLPMIEVHDIREVVETARGVPMGIAHDKTGEGTNLLFLSPPSSIDLHFGPRSFARHLADARRRGICYRVFSAPSLLWDIDSPRDMRILLSRGAGTNTHRELLRLRVDERIASWRSE